MNKWKGTSPKRHYIHSSTYAVVFLGRFIAFFTTYGIVSTDLYIYYDNGSAWIVTIPEFDHISNTNLNIMDGGRMRTDSISATTNSSINAALERCYEAGILKHKDYEKSYTVEEVNYDNFSHLFRSTREHQ